MTESRAEEICEEQEIIRKRLIKNGCEALDIKADQMGFEFESEDGIDDGGMY
jgi:hypothetical protein